LVALSINVTGIRAGLDFRGTIKTFACGSILAEVVLDEMALDQTKLRRWPE
jgi:hypothetical protein